MVGNWLFPLTLEFLEFRMGLCFALTQLPLTWGLLRHAVTFIGVEERLLRHALTSVALL